MKVKPIVLIEIETCHLIEDDRKNYLEYLTNSSIKDDYHIIAYFSYNNTNKDVNINCQCFNSDKAEEITLEKLEEIKNLIKEGYEKVNK